MYYKIILFWNQETVNILFSIIINYEILQILIAI